MFSFVIGTGLERNGMMTGFLRVAGPLMDVEPANAVIRIRSPVAFRFLDATRKGLAASSQWAGPLGLARASASWELAFQP